MYLAKVRERGYLASLRRLSLSDRSCRYPQPIRRATVLVFPLICILKASGRAVVSMYLSAKSENNLNISIYITYTWSGCQLTAKDLGKCLIYFLSHFNDTSLNTASMIQVRALRFPLSLAARAKAVKLATNPLSLVSSASFSFLSHHSSLRTLFLLLIIFIISAFDPSRSLASNFSPQSHPCTFNR